MTAVWRLLAAAALATTGLVALTPPAPAEAWEDVSDFLWITDAYPSGELEGYGDPGYFRFYDADLDPALSGLSVVASSTTDPTGIRVLAERAARADPYYWGAVDFSSAPSDQEANRLQVSDGDTVTITYSEPRDRTGMPRTQTATQTWRARTRPPDWREIGLVDPADGPAVVRGAQRSAPAGSTVRVYGAAGTESLVAGTVDGAGRFLLSVPEDLPPSVEVSTQEPGLSESDRVPLERARAGGRVLLPGEAERGVRSAMVELEGSAAPGCPPDCPRDGTLSDRDGFFYLGARSASDLPAGSYHLSTHFQGFMDAERSTWLASAYGDPAPTGVALTDSAATVVLDDVVLEGPVFVGQVLDSSGAPVVEAQIDVLDGVGGLVTNSYSREDGRFALHLDDGDYRLRVYGPVGCVRYSEAWIDVSVRDGVATPATATATIEPVGIHEEVWTIPLDPPEVGVTVRLDAPGVEITLSEPQGAGTVSIRCTTEHWDDMEVIGTPLDLDWDAGFGQATVCLDYSPARAAAAGVAEQELQLLHRSDDGAISSIATQHDAARDRVCGETGSFSDFALGVPRAQEPPPDSEPEPPDTQPEPPVTEPEPPETQPEPAPDPAPSVPQARSTDQSCPPGRVPDAGFSDVLAGNTHKPTVDCVVWWGVAKGRSPSAYAPGEPVNRAQMATFLANLLDRSGAQLPPASRDFFTDDASSLHQASINRLAQAGIVLGRADGGYHPELPVTRDAMATFLVRTYEHRTGQPLTASRDWFADDAGNAHEWSINRAAEAGLTGGTAAGGYAPSLSVKRDQMASFLARELDLLVEGGYGTPPP